MALEITKDALSALGSHMKPQRKRVYYRLRGRSAGESLFKARTKISLEDQQKLQVVLYLYSERIERKQEAEWTDCAASRTSNLGQTEQFDTPALTPRILPEKRTDEASACATKLIRHQITQEDWLVRFMKHLIAISVIRSSFYVTLGVGRVLYNYTTEEAARLYDTVIQDSDRMKDAQYFRKRRTQVLMKQLKERFGNVLQTCTVAHGEDRFVSENEAEQFIPLANLCLELFIPWSTNCVLPEKWNPMNDQIDELYFQDSDPDNEHPIEVQRMHTLIHPNCFERLTTALGLAKPHERLEIPMFSWRQSRINDQSGGDSDGGTGTQRTWPAPLTDSEIHQIEEAVKKTSERRKKSKPDAVKVMVDGVERESVRLNQGPVQFRVDECARLIEIKSKDDGLLLGTLLLERRELLRAASGEGYNLNFARGREIFLKLFPLLEADGEFAGADVEIQLHARVPLAGRITIVDALRQIAHAAVRRPAPVLGIFAILAIGTTAVLLISRMNSHRNQYVAQVQPQPSPASSSIQTSQKETKVEVAPDTNRAHGEPASRGDRSKTNNAKEETRGLSAETARELAAVRRIYVETNSEIDGKLRAVFVDAIATTGKRQVSSDADADAYLYFDLKQTNSTTRVNARLMSRNGFILWKDRRIVMGGSDTTVVVKSIARNLAARLTQ
ncbi:MAG TPA: hypothetical protein VE863_12355 [Pyrinomonadaceae bacterium]|nr:hypothetical protein [Pyrinomonadaceae bacterium]